MVKRGNQIKKILFVTLSNIGDVILTLPALDFLRASFPQASISVIVGPRTKQIFENNPLISQVTVFDKHVRLREKWKLLKKLKNEHFDLVVDLRNSFFGVFLGRGKDKIRFSFVKKQMLHMRYKHLLKLATIIQDSTGFLLRNALSDLRTGSLNKSLHINPQDSDYIRKILAENNIKDSDDLIVVASGSRSHIKRWPKERFAQLIPLLIKDFGAKICLVGDKDDVGTNEYIKDSVKGEVIDLTNKTTLAELAYLLTKAKLLITNDSATLHLGSYLNVPILAIFGPTDEIKYGPWSGMQAVMKKDISCRPCEKAQCRFGHLKCISLIKVEDVLRQAALLLHNTPQALLRKKQNFKRILIARTDRIGDVLLSTPVIKALRDEYPTAYLAMVVSPYAKDIIEGNPYVDEAIIYDKDALHKSWRRSMRFARNLRKKRFDVAIILHPINRMHLIAFFSGIKRRIGYNRKLGFLLTDRVEHTKQLGERHELEYSLDLLKPLGIEPKDKSTFMPVKNESEEWAKRLFAQEGIKGTDRLLAINPGASCPSKIWPPQRFSEVADRLTEKYGFKVLLVGGSKDLTVAVQVYRNMHKPAINLVGLTSVSQLASILKCCNLFISNDSGPVHIACALNIPVISIFGRSQKGLSPRRWGPRGENAHVIHKSVGCVECLAHNCVKGFACLKAVSVSDVLELADIIMKGGKGV